MWLSDKVAIITGGGNPEQVTIKNKIMNLFVWHCSHPKKIILGKYTLDNLNSVNALGKPLLRLSFDFGRSPEKTLSCLMHLERFGCKRADWVFQNRL
jgi:hypothetical protein